MSPDRVKPSVREPFYRSLASLALHALDDSVRDQDRGPSLTAVMLDAARNVHCIAQDRQFQPALASDIAEHDIAVMDPDGNGDRFQSRRRTFIVPYLEPRLHGQRTPYGVRGTQVVRDGQAEYSDQTVARELVDGTVVLEHTGTQGAQQFPKHGDHILRLQSAAELRESNHIDEQDRSRLISGRR